MQSDLFSTGDEIKKVADLFLGIFGHEITPSTKAWIAHKKDSRYTEAQYLAYYTSLELQANDLPF